MRRDQDKSRAGLAFAVSFAFVGFGAWRFAVLAELESSGRGRRVHALEHLVYGLGGKFAVLAMFLALAAYTFRLGLRHYRGA